VIFVDTGLTDAVLIRPEKRGDDRGFFARAWCEREFAAHGLDTRIAQANMSGSADMGTLRGMHLQVPPAAETKIIRCTAGAIYDVIVDLRPRSATYKNWYGTRLDAVEHDALYVPEGFAHGFLTLEPDTEVYYLVSASYAPDCERGVRHDDPAFGIDWPGVVEVMSDKDRSWPDYVAFPELADL
jgi:dTDP-4-dehydrorhamnose 3,5-epimerase